MSKGDGTPVWEVFAQEKSGAPHVHVGNVHAADAELALLAARDVYARRGKPTSLWVVPSRAITAGFFHARARVAEQTLPAP